MLTRHWATQHRKTRKHIHESSMIKNYGRSVRAVEKNSKLLKILHETSVTQIVNECGHRINPEFLT